MYTASRMQKMVHIHNKIIQFVTNIFSDVLLFLLVGLSASRTTAEGPFKNPDERNVRHRGQYVENVPGGNMWVRLIQKNTANPKPRRQPARQTQRDVR